MSEAPNFDRVARIYRWAEYAAMGTLLQTIREHFLPQMSRARKSLVLGDGDGRFAKTLFDQNPLVQVHAVDLSAEMLALLKKRSASHAGRLTVTQGDALEVDLPQNADLVVTHFFLDCFTQAEVDHLVTRVSHAAARGTFWVVSDFAVPRGWMEVPARFYIRALYLAFRLLTKLRVQQLPDPQGSLSRAGFVCIERYTRFGGILYTELWQRE